jgi:hypothetical protein
MILSKKDYKIWREADRISLGVSKNSINIMRNEIYLFEIRLRKLELAINCSKNRIRILS